MYQEFSQIKLIATDMDHTLLTETGELPPDFDQYIDALDAKGIYLAIASGRPLYTLEALFPESRDKLCLISDNGGMISVKGKVIFKSLMPVEDYQSMYQVTAMQPVGAGVICGLDAAYIDEKYRQYDNVFRRFYTNIVYVTDMAAVEVEADKYTIYYPDRDARKWCDQVFLPGFGDRFSVTLGDDVWIDIMNKGVDKGRALCRLGEYIGCGTEQMMAFGDNYNDIEMLETVKYSYIMKNAIPEMKQYGRFEADTNDHYGVLKVLDEVLKA